MSHRLPRRIAALLSTTAVIAMTALALPAAGAVDTVAPTLTGFRLTNTVADLAADDSSVGVVVHSADDVDGVSSIHVTATCAACPAGTEPLSTYGDWYSNGGPASNEFSTVRLEVPQGTAVGSWVITSVQLYDGDNHVRTYDDAGLTGLGVSASSRTFTVTAPTDATAPSLAGMSIRGPASISVTTADREVLYEVHATDAYPGVADGSFTLTNAADALDTRTGYFSSGDRVRGSAGDGWFDASTSFGVEDAGKTWHVTSMTLTDRAGNTATQAPAVPVPTLTIAATGDSAAPHLASLSLPTTAVDPTADDAEIAASAHVTDDATGLSYGYLGFTGPEDAFGTPGSASIYFSSADLMTGTVTDGTFTSLTPVNDWNQSLPGGHYALSSVLLVDRAGNTYDSEFDGGLPVAGFDLAPSPGNDPPVVQSVVLAPQRGNGTVTLNTDEACSCYERSAGAYITITDDTGLAAGTVRLTSPAGSATATEVGIGSEQRVQGTRFNGVYRVELPADVAGSYTISAITITDRDAKTSVYSDQPADNPTDSLAGVTHNTFTYTAAVQPGDVSAPTISQIDVAAGSVDSSSDLATFPVTITAADSGTGGVPATGITDISLEWTSPNGQASVSTYVNTGTWCWAYVDGSCLVNGLVAGSDEAGTFRAIGEVNQYSEPGTYTLTDVTVTDRRNNTRSYTTPAELAVIAGSKTLQVVGVGDSAAPTVNSISTNPAPVTAGTKSYRVEFTAGLTDALSGVSSLGVAVVSPNGQQSVYGWASAPVDGSGNWPHTASLTALLDFPAYAQTGAWQISDVYIDDGYGNYQDLTNAQLVAAGLPSTVQVTGPPDTTPPTLSSLALDRTSIDVTSADQPVVLDAHATDAASGVDSITATLTGPSNYTRSEPVYRMGGTSNDGYFVGIIDFTRFTPPGTWTISELDVVDLRGNHLTLGTAALQQRGFATDIAVAGSVDASAPTVTAFHVASPGSVTIPSAGGTATINANVSIADAGSGLTDGWLVFTSPNGNSVSASFDASDLPAGQSPNNVSLAVPVTFHASDEAGTWTLSYITVNDGAGNSSTYVPSTLPAGSTTTINVTNGFAPTYDGVVSGVVSTTSGPVTGAPVSVCNVANWHCSTVTTAADGSYSVGNLSPGDYSVTANPPAGSTLNRAEARITDLFAAPGHAVTKNFLLQAPVPLSSGTSVNGTTTGIPTVYWGSPINISTQGCPGATSATYTVTLPDGTVVSSGSLTESPAGTYKATVPAPYPNHGTTNVGISLHCPDNTVDNDNGFTMYIDPSGFVRDVHGAAIVGATVTLSTATGIASPFTAVPNGSAVMSPSNRVNPDVSDATGHYGWDTLAGFYRVRAEKPGCYQPGNPSQHYVDSGVVEVPPAVTDLNLTLDCTPLPATLTASTPPDTAVLTHAYSYTFGANGSPAPTFSVASGTLPAGLSLNAVTGVLSGTPTTAASYTFTVRATNNLGNQTSSPITMQTRYTDVPANQQFATDIYWLAGSGITTGFSDGTFRPLGNITRQAFAAYLYRYDHHGATGGPCAPGGSTFTDVLDSNQFCMDIKWLASTGITTGFADGGFHPAAAIARQGVAAFLYRYNHPGANPGACPAGTSSFNDVADSNQFCMVIKWLATTSPQVITTGFPDGGFHPLAIATRQAAAAYFHRYDTDFPRAP
jgi:hypothetical protein